mgnify:FL=1
MKNLISLIYFAVMFCNEWIDFEGQKIVPNSIIIRIKNEFAPKLGEESKLKSKTLHSYSKELPEIKSFEPLYNTVDSEKYYKFNLHCYYIVELENDQVSKDIIQKFSDLLIVDKVELNSRNEIYLTPNDPFYSNQWNHNNYGQVSNGNPDADIDTDEAWDVSIGSDNIIIAILDSGVDLDHPDYVDKITNGYDFANNDTNADDDNGHGTACAGIAAATGNNGIGISGICWNCKIMPVKVMGDEGTGQDTDIAQGVIWASDNGAHVVSMSLGGGMYNSYFEDAIDYATNNGTTVIAATGNDDFGTISYPARYDNCIAVGAMSPCNERKNSDSCDGENFWGSNYGIGIDLLAPGVKIPATSIGGGYTTQFNGTSSACPHAAGVAGLIYSVMSNVTPEEVRTIMQIQSDDIGAIGYDLETGFGRLNASKSIRNLLETPDLVLSDSNIDFVIEQESSSDYLFIVGNAGNVDLEFTINQDGYSWNNSSDGNGVSNWIDISNEGLQITFNHNDQGVSNIPISFDFPFFNSSYTSLLVNPNGWIGFGNDNDSWDNTGLPNEEAPLNAIFGFWDDLNPINNNCNTTCAGNVYYHSNQSRMVIWFEDVAHWVTSDYPNSFVNFQYVLYPDGKIEINYLDIVGSSSPTIGLQNQDATEAVLISLYQEPSLDLNVQNNQSISLYQFPYWLTSDINSGILQGGDAVEVIFTANSLNLPPGNYSSLFWMTTNDYNNQLINISVNLDVIEGLSPCSDWTLGDLNNDRVINVLDILRIINIILITDEDIDLCVLWAADCNLDDSINVTDIIFLVNIILNQTST